jgi:hypothetical protein
MDAKALIDSMVHAYATAPEADRDDEQYRAGWWAALEHAVGTVYGLDADAAAEWIHERHMVISDTQRTAASAGGRSA